MSKSKFKLPKYVSLNGTAMRLKGKEYWRDAGLWGVTYKVKDSKVYSTCKHTKWLNNVELTEITEEEWRKQNYDYI